MQIFVTDYDPKIAAQNLCDTHLNKAISESAQMLSTFIWCNEMKNSYTKFPNHLGWSHQQKENYKKEIGLCVPCYINHPCNVWLREDIKNVHWLHNHFIFLLLEYFERKGKSHECVKYSTPFRNYLMPLYDYHYSRPDNFCLCMPDEFKCAIPHPTEMKLVTDSVQSYRNYYVFKYNSNPRLRKYTNREMPQWLKDSIKEN